MRLLRTSYYAALNAHGPFREGLRALRAAFVADRGSSADNDRRAREFAVQWRLPRRYGVRDLLWSLKLFDDARITAGPRLFAAGPTRPISPVRRSPAYLRRAGDRLVKRAVLRWSWDRVWRAEHASGNDDAAQDASSVRQSTIAFAKDLDVPLPVIPAGRPRKLGK